jgi:hypothetical protein
MPGWAPANLYAINLALFTGLHPSKGLQQFNITRTGLMRTIPNDEGRAA